MADETEGVTVEELQQLISELNSQNVAENGPVISKLHSRIESSQKQE